ncbi:MAG: AAA family ATPase [Planctomycetaceae bacterium]
MSEDDWGPPGLPFHSAGKPFLTTSFEEAAARLLFLSERRWPAGWLVGPGGCGKTSLLRHVRCELRRLGVEALLISLCGVDGDDFWPVIASALGGRECEPGLAARKMARALLVASSMMSRPVTLLLDDADRGGIGLMDQVDALVRMAEGVTPRHTVVLATAGEPPTDDLARRIDLRAEVRPLTVEETASYIAHRLREVDSATVFSAEAVDEIFAATAGVPAAVGRLADLSLLAAHAANVRTVSREVATSAVTELGPNDDEMLVAISAQRPARFCT